MLRLLLLVFSFCLPLAAYATVRDMGADGTDYGLSMMLLMMVLAFLGIMLLGMILLVLIGAIIAFLGALGVISLSALAAIYYRSIIRGVQTFMMLVFIPLGIGTGFLFCIIYQWLWPAQVSWCDMLIVALPAGAAGGFMLARLTLACLGKVFAYFQGKVR